MCRRNRTFRKNAANEDKAIEAKKEGKVFEHNQRLLVSY